MPFAATGGLGDVLGSLPTALASKGVDVRVVMPLYSAVGEKYRAEMKKEAEFDAYLAWRKQYCGVYSLIKDKVTYYFIDNEYYFAREGLYGQFDDGERYAFFCTAVLEMLPHIGFFPDILHAHDWQAALSVIYLRQKYSEDERYAGIRRVFAEKPEAFDPREYLKVARAEVKKMVSHKIVNVLGSDNKLA